MSAIVWIIYLAIIAIVIAGAWKMFVKAGQPGWAAIIPIYNVIVGLQIVRRPVWWIVLFFIPFVNIVMGIIIAIDLAKAFGRSPAFGVIMLWLLGIIGIPMLGFGSATYRAPDRAPA